MYPISTLLLLVALIAVIASFFVKGPDAPTRSILLDRAALVVVIVVLLLGAFGGR